MGAGICFVCGKRLTNAIGEIVSGVERSHYGARVRMHKGCAKSYDADKPLTAIDTTLARADAQRAEG